MPESPSRLQRRLNIELTTDGALALERGVRRSEQSKVSVATRALKLLDLAEQAIEDGAEIVFRYPDGQREVTVKIL